MKYFTQKDSAKVDYPTQMADIHANAWRMQFWMDRGQNPEELKREESRLWTQIKDIVAKATPPPPTLNNLSHSELIGYGWEWAVYSLMDSKYVVKVPAGIFQEVNAIVYLDNARYAYRTCQNFLQQFIVPSEFDRINFGKTAINMISQERLISKTVHSFQINQLSSALKSQLLTFSLGILEMARAQKWMPDITLSIRNEGSNSWRLRNIAFQDDKPLVFDFTTYYDVFRLYPERTYQELQDKTTVWETFISEIRKTL